MKITYDFDKIIDRTGTSCAKWDSTEQIFGEKDLLPMWVADMDFQSPPVIIDALVKRAQHGFFGYSVIDEDYKEVVCSWFKRRHNCTDGHYHQNHGNRAAEITPLGCIFHINHHIKPSLRG